MSEAREIPLDTSGAKFLMALDAIVCSDKGAPGFSGKVALGVRDVEQDIWWCAEATTEVQTSFSKTEPSGTNASVLIGTYELRGFMKTGRIPDDARVVICRGDVQLFQTVMHRYAVSKSAVDIRAAEPNTRRPKKRKRS